MERVAPESFPNICEIEVGKSDAFVRIMMSADLSGYSATWIHYKTSDAVVQFQKNQECPLLLTKLVRKDPAN